MPNLEPVDMCVPPGGQVVLFRFPIVEVAPSYAVTDSDGRTRVRTNSLGVALTIVRRVLLEKGEAWVRASDDTTAHIEGHHVRTDTPDLPWIASLAATLED